MSSGNNDSVVIDSTSVTLTTTTTDPGGSTEIVEVESTEVVPFDISGLSFSENNSNQQPAEAAAMADHSIAQALEPTASQTTEELGLNGFIQALGSPKINDSMQLIDQPEPTSIAQSLAESQQDVYLQQIEGFSASTSSQSPSYTQSNVLPPQTDSQSAYTQPYSALESTVQSQLIQQAQQSQQARQAQQNQQSQQSTPYQTTLQQGVPMHPDPHQDTSSETLHDLQQGQYSLNSQLEQSAGHQGPQPTPSSPSLQTPQLSTPSQESANLQNIDQQSVMYPESQPAHSSQMAQSPQFGQSTQEPWYPQSGSYSQSTVYQDAQAATLDQTLQNPLADPYAQNHFYTQNNTDQGTYYQNPQTSESSASNIESRSQGYNEPNFVVDPTPKTIATDYSLLANNNDTSLLVTGSDQQNISNQTDDGPEPVGGSFLGSFGIDEDFNVGDSFGASLGDGDISNIVVNTAAIANAGASIANSAISALSNDAGIAQQAANAMTKMNPAAVVGAGVGIANTAVNAMSDPAAAVQAGLGVAMSGVRIAASIGTWNAARQRQKEAAARFVDANGPANPAVTSQVATATQLDEILLVMSVLGQRLVVLEVVNFAELPQALAACRSACGQADSGDLLAHLDTLDGTLQYSVTAALFFCAACFPMHIYRGFGTGVLDNFLWGCPHPQYATGPVAGFKSVDRTIAFLKSMPREVQLLTRIPAGLSRIVPTVEKSDRIERRKLMNAYREFIKEIEKKGHPQPKDGSFRVVTWHFPFATWISPFTFKNSGHFFEDLLRWQLDPGRLLHAWTIGGHLDLMHGEMMWLPSGIAETLARWLVGLPGTTFQLVPTSAFNYSNLKLSPATRSVMLEQGFETVKAVRDPRADFRRPIINQNVFVPAPPPLRTRKAPMPQSTHQPSQPNVGAAKQTSQHTAYRPNVSQPESDRSMHNQQTRNPSVNNPHMAHQPGGHQSVAYRNFSPQPVGQQVIPSQITSQRVASNPAASPVAGVSPVASLARNNTASNSTTRPGLVSHQTAPDPAYHHAARSSPVASQSIAQQPMESIPMTQHQSQQRTFSTPNVLASNYYGQPMNPQAIVPQPTLQQYQPPLANQRPVSAMQAMSPHANPPQNPFPQAASNAYNASSPKPLTRKPTNASRFSAGENPAATNMSRLSSNPSSNPLSRVHSPISSLSRTSTLSSQHSSSSPAPSPSRPVLDSPITSPSPTHNPPQTPFPSLQPAKTIKRRPVPLPPPPPPLLPLALRQVKAIHDFTPEQENELGFKVGDVLDVLDDSSGDGWWEARLGTTVGAIPAAYVGDV